MSVSRLLSALFLIAIATSAQDRPAPPGDEPEEPDFAFVSGSAYTQVAKSIQFIHQTAYRTRGFTFSGGSRNEDEFLFFLRTEYGVTDRWEVDVVTPGSGSRTRENGRTVASDYGFADSLIGVRYQVLHEHPAPFALAIGPQLILPTGRLRKGTGKGSAGFAWDVAASKDWGGPVFLYGTCNYRVLPWAEDPTPGSSRSFTLQGMDFATALGLRALERPRNGSKHDLHVLLEAGGSWEQEVEPGVLRGQRRSELLWIASPGVRYGFLTRRRTLVEIGVAAPIGLGPNGPKKGIFVQFQFEKLFQPPAE